jgi:hypothetical protein
LFRQEGAYFICGVGEMLLELAAGLESIKYTLTDNRIFTILDFL